jgi:hypothetical protein
MFDVEEYLTRLGFTYKPVFFWPNIEVGKSEVVRLCYTKDQYEVSITYSNTKHDISEIVVISFEEDQSKLAGIKHRFNETVKRHIVECAKRSDGFIFNYAPLFIDGTVKTWRPNRDSDVVTESSFNEIFTELNWVL